MADAVLFEFLHTEMVAELWARDPDPSSGDWDFGRRTMFWKLHRLWGQPETKTQSLSSRICLWGKKKSLLVLEGLGFRVGQALGERLPQETLAFREELDALKFLCKDLWAAMFQKHMDGLRTNHQGTYVLQDNSFPLLITMGSGSQYLEEAPKFLAFTCGLLCGALHTLGFQSLVTASVAVLPACKFQVVIQKS